MNPKPLLSLNHFTFPVVLTYLLPFSISSESGITAPPELSPAGGSTRDPSDSCSTWASPPLQDPPSPTAGGVRHAPATLLDAPMHPRGNGQRLRSPPRAAGRAHIPTWPILPVARITEGPLGVKRYGRFPRASRSRRHSHARTFQPAPITPRALSELFNLCPPWTAQIMLLV